MRPTKPVKTSARPSSAASATVGRSAGSTETSSDYVHSRGHNEPMTPQINYFEDPVTHLPQSPARYGRPYPAYTNIVMSTSTGKSAYDGLQLGVNARTRRVLRSGTY